MMNVKTKPIGTIVSFDSASQMATVKLACNGTNSTLDSNYFNQQGLTLIDVPVEFPRCGEFCITFPVKAGDDCIVEFFEQGITHWLYDNRREYKVVDGRPEPAARRRFSRQDAVARVAVDNTANPITGFNSGGMEIRSRGGNQKVVLHPDGRIELLTDSTVEINAKDIETTSETFKVNAQTVEITGSSSVSIGGSGALSLSGSSIAMTEA